MSSSPESRAPRAPPASSLRNFSFALGAQLAGSDVPRVRADFEAWHARGVRAILNVHTHAHAQLYNAGADTFVEEITPLGFRCLHVPVEDLTAPTQAQIADSVAFIRACIADRLPVVVHCRAGLGRTGTMLACALISLSAAAASGNSNGDGDSSAALEATLVAPTRDARAWAEQTFIALRAVRPGSVETRDQLDAIIEWARAVGATLP